MANRKASKNQLLIEAFKAPKQLTYHHKYYFGPKVFERCTPNQINNYIKAFTKNGRGTVYTDKNAYEAAFKPIVYL